MNRNWGLIRSGPTFQTLVGALVLADDPGAAVFGRPGKDGGIDALSGDRKTVYQAKWHESPAAATVIREALTEASKIKQYRKPESANAANWEGVGSWTLATNVEFNPNDLRRWEDEVVPAFRPCPEFELGRHTKPVFRGPGTPRTSMPT
jgi:hypothetical protein